MKAKDLIIDFINYAFLLILISFCVTFFIIGDRFFLFGVFLKIILPFSIFGIFFLINLKIQRNSIIKFDNEGVLNEIIGYLTDQDRLKDKIVLIILPIVILSANFINGYLVFLDIAQAILAFFYMFLWHKILFKPQENAAKITFLRNIDKIKDEIAIYILPLLVSGFGMFRIEVNAVVNFFQGIACLVIMLSWHYILFRDRN
jgi:hypothetical protein